jgi:hypothetical protein
MRTTIKHLALAAIVCLAMLAAATAVAGESSTVKVKRKPSDKEWKEFPARTVADLPGFKQREVTLDKYGGWTERRGKATGFFHVERSGDRWWLVDPGGCLFLHVAVNSVGPGRTPTSTAALKKEFGTPAAWAERETQRLRDAGFNGAGAWSDVPLLRSAKEPLVYSPEGTAAVPGKSAKGGFLRSFGNAKKLAKQGSGHAMYPNDCIPVFHPDFPAFCDAHAKPLAALKDDPWLLGYFSDNELPMPRLEKYLALDPNDADMQSSLRAAQQWLDKRKGKNATAADITEADRDAWIEHAFGRYFELTTAAIRRYDPNHLCLGSRFYGAEKGKATAFRAAGKWLDVIAVNHYGVWEPQAKDIARWTEWSGKPVMITEWYAKGMDAGYANNSGAGWTVPTQRDRGLFYQTYTLGLLRSKNCVGWHWFKYMDNDPDDTKADPSNRDSNKGVVTIRYEPYAPLLNLMQNLNRNVYPLTAYFDEGKQER